MKNLGNDNVIPGLTRDPRRDTALTPTLSQNWERGTTKRVLFLSLSGIGNLIMQLPTIKALKKAHPTWHITVWVAPRGTKEIAEAQPYIDKVIEMQITPTPSSSPSGRGRARDPSPFQGEVGWGGNVLSKIILHLKNIITIRKHHFDIGIVLSPGQLMKSAAYLKLAGIPVRIGNSYPYKNNPTSSTFLTHAIDEGNNLHDIEQNLKLLELLHIHPEIVQYYSLAIPEKNIKESLSSPLLTKERPGEVSYVGIHAGSAPNFEFKRWPLERFAEVAKALLQKDPNIQFLIFGGPDEEAQKQELVKMINKSSIPSPVLGEGEDEGKLIATNAPHPNPLPNSIAVAISTSLLTTAAIMQKCNLMISNDSGLMHLAAAVGTPVIGIFGPTDEALTGPRGPKSSVVRAAGTKPVYDTEKSTLIGTTTHQSMLAITPQAIIGKINQMNIL